MRLAARHPALLLLLTACAGVAAAQPRSLCDALTEAQVRALTGVASGAYSRRPARFSPASLRCVFGVTNGSLVLDAFRMDTDASALALMSHLGQIRNSSNFTTSPYGTDQIDTLRTVMQSKPDLGPFDLNGVLARHGNMVVSLGVDFAEGGFHPAAPAVLEAVALQLAGAHVVPWPVVDVCARVPAASVQTLVALGPARLLSSVHHSAGGNSDCTYVFHPIDGEGDTRVVLKSEQWINDLEAMAHDKSKPVPLPFTTSDPSDTALSVAEPGYMAAALHAGQLGRVDIYSPGNSAEHDDSIRTHLAQAALLAAGGKITGGAGLQAIPAPVAPTPFTSAEWSIRNALRDFWFLWFLLAVAGLILRARHRKQQLRVNGLPGTAVVDSISETGITVNNSPMIKLNLTITPEGRDSYPGSTRKVVSRLEQPSNWIGRRLNLRIDRNNPSRFLIVP